MKKQLTRYVWVFPLALAIFGPISATGGVPAEVPEPMRELFSRSAFRPASLPDRVVSSKQNPRVGTASYTAEQWVRKVLRGAWLPDHLELVCIAHEFGQYDVVRSAWRHSGYELEVAQTAGMFGLAITPAAPPSEGAPRINLTRLDDIRGLVASLLVAEDQRMPGIPITNIVGRVLFSSFEPSVVSTSADGRVLYGRRKTLKEAGVYGKEAMEAEWDKSAWPYLTYWFTMIDWWSDGKTLRLYFPKSDGGPRLGIGYSGRINQVWFEDWRGPSDTSR